MFDVHCSFHWHSLFLVNVWEYPKKRIPRYKDSVHILTFWLSLYFHNPNNNTTHPQHFSLVGHENECAPDTANYWKLNSMKYSAIFQLVLYSKSDLYGWKNALNSEAIHIITTYLGQNSILEKSSLNCVKRSSSLLDVVYDSFHYSSVFSADRFNYYGRFLKR